MTSRDPWARDRADDRPLSRCHRFYRWCSQHRDVISDVILGVVGIGLIWITAAFYISQSNTKEQARAFCERSRVLAPFTTDFLDHAGVYPRDQFAVFEGRRMSIRDIAISSIPTDCGE